ncbi:MAG: zinc carboxypeptidase [Erysipelotrichaceae bacterium]|nr:zinc carboxypeptidase [Erysipelotrichaceae bacterium]
MKTTLTYDKYFTQTDREKNIAVLKDKFADLITVESICKTKEGKDVLALTITADNKKASEKPAFYIDGNTHAGEVTGMMAAMHTADYLLTNYATDEKVKKLLDDNTFYIIPCVSPDGSDAYLTGPAILRSVNRDYIKDPEGLYQKDIDDDGVIRMMRVKTKYGAWKKDPDNDDLMVPRTMEDREGDFYDVYTEGLIDGYDGVDVKVKRADWGLDFNRNYPFGWNCEPIQQGAGPYPLSNPETKAVVDFVNSHPNICAVLTHHTSGGILLTPPGNESEAKAPKYDIEVYNQLGAICQKKMGYKKLNIFDSFLSDQEHYDSGAFDDWCYGSHGIYATTLELWNLEERAGVPMVYNKPENLFRQAERTAACYKWVKENCPDKYASWKKCEHPQLGAVETGGFDIKQTFQNPPVSFLVSELEKTTDFSIAYASMLPKLVIESVDKEDLGNGFFKVSIIVGNTGYLPTYVSDRARFLKENKGIEIVIKGFDEIIEGKEKTVIEDLSSFSKTNTDNYFYGNISTFNSDPIHKKVTWIIKKSDSKPVEITVSSRKAGVVNTSI